MTVKPELYNKNLFRVKSACNLISRPDPDRIVKNQFATIVELVEQRQAGRHNKFNIFNAGYESVSNGWRNCEKLDCNDSAKAKSTLGNPWQQHAFDFMRILNLDLTGNLTF